MLSGLTHGKEFYHERKPIKRKSDQHMGRDAAEAVDELARKHAEFRWNTESRTLDKNHGSLASFSERDPGCTGRMDPRMDRGLGQCQRNPRRATASGSPGAGTVAALDRSRAADLARLVRYRKGHQF